MGSGTVSNADPARGASCIAEKRTREKLDTGTITTPFLKFGDLVRKQAARSNIKGFQPYRIPRMWNVWAEG